MDHGDALLCWTYLRQLISQPIMQHHQTDQIQPHLNFDMKFMDQPHLNFNVQFMDFWNLFSTSIDLEAFQNTSGAAVSMYTSFLNRGGRHKQGQGPLTHTSEILQQLLAFPHTWRTPCTKAPAHRDQPIHSSSVGFCQSTSTKNLLAFNHPLDTDASSLFTKEPALPLYEEYPLHKVFPLL